MIKESVSLDELKQAIASHKAQESAPSAPVPLDSKGRVYATGKRKTAVARVWIKPGSGCITVNNRSDYFGQAVLEKLVLVPFRSVDRTDRYDVWCSVKGGGSMGQAGAVRHGISKALNLFEPTLRPLLKQAGLLTRDARKVERKKPGLRKARRAPQFSKR